MSWRSAIQGHRPSLHAVVRMVFVCLLVVSVLLVVDSYTTASTARGASVHAAAPPADGPTVIAGQQGHLYGYDANGSLLFDEHDYDAYWDVDPSPAGDATLLYTATEKVAPDRCGSTACVRNVVERLNFSTGERTTLFERLIPDRGDKIRWHDADRINATHYVVAGIARDRVFVFDAETDQITWQWDAQSHYSIDSGGSYPGDWTHVNDVEVLSNGWFMFSPRNHDQVAFIDPGRGVVDNWTLGADNRYDTLYEQHNPDYIPEERGGPAVVVADSQNNRVIEYQRTNDSWARSWAWSDDHLQWPRDADRLPSGNTLLTDSNGDRVLEVDRNGTVVWSVPAQLPYEAERLGTGDESAGGESAASLDLESRVLAEADDASNSPSHRLWIAVKTTMPALPLNAALYALPGWIAPINFPPLVLAALSIVGLLGSEVAWNRERLRARLGAWRPW